MDEAESRRAKDVESLKVQLKNIKQQLEEIIRKTESVKNEIKEENMLYSKTFRNIQKIQSSQALKMNKLEVDIKSIEELYVNQSAERRKLVEAFKKLNEDFKNLTKDSEKKLAENQKACFELDKEIKLNFVKCQCDQELINLWEMGQNFSSKEDEWTFKKVFFKIKAEADKRYDNFRQEFILMDEVLMRLRDEIKEKREKFTLTEAKFNLYKDTSPEEIRAAYKILDGVYEDTDEEEAASPPPIAAINEEKKETEIKPEERVTSSS